MRRKTLIPILAIVIIGLPAAFAEDCTTTNEVIIASSIADTANATADSNVAVVAENAAAIGNADASVTANAGIVVVHAILITDDTAVHQHSTLIAANNEAALHQANSVTYASNANPAFIREAQPANTAPRIKACGNSSALVANAAPGLTKGGCAANTAAGIVSIRA